MDNILIIGPQFGYNTDWYKFAELLTNQYKVYYVCRKIYSSLIESDRVTVIYYTANNNNYYYKVLFALSALKKQVCFKRVFVYVYPTCSLLRLLFNKEKLVLDVRTSYIKSPLLTKICNKLIRIESCFYSTISVISWGVADFLKLNKSKCRLLPLGGEKLDFVDKSFNELKLLYVGTFFDRNIEITVDGFTLFMKANPDAKVRYTIVGTGSDIEKEKINQAIKSSQYKDHIEYLGEKRGDELKKIMAEHNVGVSYIPLTDYYDCQPPTKTFEYLLASMVVLATPTSENKKVICDTNGRLSASDSSEDFAVALQYIFDNRRSYNLIEIYDSSIQYSWECIVNKYLLPIC
jgi:glycosyltransferase involved in cell wall biosynthesis